MSTELLLFIDDESKPTNFPDFETIITQCFKLGPKQATNINISGVHIALDKRSDQDVNDIWIKYGRNVTMGEAMTQRFVGQHLQKNNSTAVRAPQVYLAFTYGGFGFIVGEYIDGKMCDASDTGLVAAAVQVLISIPSPSSTPGRIGGGLIEHPFFVERTSPIQYESVEELEDHVNGILSVTGRKNRVRLCEEVANYGLRLCVSDLKRVNFMKDKDDGIVAVDYGGYSFLPPSFFTLSLRDGDFAYQVSLKLEYPPCKENTTALMIASYALVPFNTNTIGMPKRLKSRIHR